MGRGGGISRGGGGGGGRGRGGARGSGRGGARGGRGGGSSRGAGGGRVDGGSRSAIYSMRHKRIFDNDGDGDSDDGNADDFALDDLVGDEQQRTRSDERDFTSLRHQEEVEERAVAARQKKLDRKQARKQAKVDKKQGRITAQHEWSELCRKRRDEKEKQREMDKAKAKKKYDREQQQKLLLRRKQEGVVLAKKKTKGEEVAAAPAGKKKAVSFDAAVKKNAENKKRVKEQQQQQQKQQKKNKEQHIDSTAAPAAAAPAPGAYVPPALRAQKQPERQVENDDDDDDKKKKKKSAADKNSEPPAAASLAKYVVPARRHVSPSLTSLVQRCLNKLVLDNVAAISNELVNIFSSSTDSRSDITFAVGTTVVNSSIGSAHLTTRQAIAIAGVVRALQLKCGADVGAALVSRVATELRAAILLGPDSSAVHTSKFLEEIERKATHGAVMLGALTHMACCSAHLALSFLHECSLLLQQISQQQANSSNNSSSPSFLNEATCIASCCLQLLRVVGDKLFELVPMQLNGWINHVEQQLHQEQKTSASSSSGSGGPIRFATLRLEVVLSLAKQFVSGGGAASGSRRQRGDEQQAQSSNSNSKKGNSPDEETLTQALDALADVVRPGASAQDRRTWKRAFPAMSVPTLEWPVASQPEKQGPRWWEAKESSGSGLLYEQENESKLSGSAAVGVERRDLFANQKNNNDDDDDAEEEDTEQQFEYQLDEDDVQDEKQDEDDDDEKEEHKRQQKLRGIKRLRSFESAASGQRFVSERQRTILQVLDSAFDDGEACQRLMHHLQQNEASDVASVILQCCMQETTYNSFYAKVTSRLLSPSMPKKMLTKTKKAFQYAIWDKFGGLRVDAAASGGAPPDVASLVNLAGFVVHLFAEDRYNLSLLRGLDMDVSIPASVGLFLRILLLRCLLLLDFPAQMVALFFGHHTSKKGGGEDSGDELEEDGFGNVRSVLGANSVVKQKLRAALLSFFDAQFVDEVTASKWMVPLFDIVAGNSLEEEELAGVMEELPKRIKTVKRAMRDGGE